MKYILLFLVTVFMLSDVCEAKRTRRKSNTTYYKYTTSIDNTSAQGVANTMASRNCVSHFGGHHNTYEGCGSGWTQNEAYNNCCYSNSGMHVVDVGYAQSKYGMWYCCKRYSRY
tara:strand:+ start:2756 stop:3097 length:342 start_codon:yes stop_codon:yes gene_type:complete